MISGWRLISETLNEFFLESEWSGWRDWLKPIGSLLNEAQVGSDRMVLLLESCFWQIKFLPLQQPLPCDF